MSPEISKDKSINTANVATVEGYLYRDVEILAIEHDLWRFYRLVS